MRIPLLLFYVAATALGDDGRGLRQMASHAEVVAIFADLLGNGWNGLRQTESAAFIVRDGTRGYRAVPWPYTGEKMRQRYRGAVPPSTVAIAHTHPRSVRFPSAGDAGTAAAVGVPVFVLTPFHIWVVTPEGTMGPIVERTDWANRWPG
ncbi:MAG TPA: hypothetical protein VGF40_00280 [Thermoanaerobaculia bacterium]